MKILGLATGLLLSAVIARANPYSFASNFFKDPTIRMPSLSLLGDAAAREDVARPFLQNNARNSSGPTSLLGAVSHFRKVGDGLVSHMPIVKPNPMIDYKLAVPTPAPGVDYKLRVLEPGIASVN